MPLTVGTRLGPYEVLAPIGAGGMGEVYRARDSRLGREVALKILPAAFASDPDRVRRFEQEGRAAAALNHPNIVVIYDSGSDGGVFYVATELLEGETLRERLAGAALPVRKAVDYAIQTARGLAAAHAKGITHRDLKPENLFLTKDGLVKILDFGLAKHAAIKSAGTHPTELATQPIETDPGKVLGTVGYMSPEQVRGQVGRRPIGSVQPGRGAVRDGIGKARVYRRIRRGSDERASAAIARLRRQGKTDHLGRKRKVL